MTGAEIIKRLAAVENRRAVARETAVPYDYLCRLVKERIKNPGMRHLDVLRMYFERQDRPQ